MERSEIIAVTKQVKDWAVSIGIPRAKVHTRTSVSGGSNPYISFSIRSESFVNHRDPIQYAALVPRECCNRMIKIIYPDSAWAETSFSAGNVFQHMIAAHAHQWIAFLAGERALQAVPA